MSSVLVTGASGFLGAAVTPRLSQAGHRAIGLDPVPASDPARRHVIDDLSDRRRLTELLRAENVTHVLHCGGVSGPMVLADNSMRVIDINVRGSLNLLQAALATGIKTFVYCSSVSALGDFYEQEPIDSDYPLRPTSTYGSSKAAMDMVLRGLYVFVTERGGPATTAGFLKMIARTGEATKTPFPVHPHMLRHCTGYKLANDGHDPRALQHYMGHKNIMHTVRYIEMAPDQFKNFWGD